MRAKEFINESTGDKKFDTMMGKIINPTPAEVSNRWHRELVYKLSHALPQDLRSDNLLDVEDIRYWLGDNPLVDQFEALDFEDQATIIDMLSNYFYQKNGMWLRGGENQDEQDL